MYVKPKPNIFPVIQRKKKERTIESFTMTKNGILSVQKQAEALKLRIAGATFQQIADRLQYASPSGAYRAVELGLQRTLQEPSDMLRQLERERLDQMLLGIWKEATNGNLGAIDRAIKIMQRRAALIGLDAPTKVEVMMRKEAEAIAQQLGIPVEDVLEEAEKIAQSAWQTR